MHPEIHAYQLYTRTCARVERNETAETNECIAIFLQSDPLMSEEDDRSDVVFDRAASTGHPDSMHHQDAMQNRERSKLLLRKLNQNRERGKAERDQERERLQQLQSINNLLLDLPSPSTHLSSYSQDASSSQSSDKNLSTDGKTRVNKTIKCARIESNKVEI